MRHPLIPRVRPLSQPPPFRGGQGRSANELQTRASGFAVGLLVVVAALVIGLVAW